MHNQDGVPQEDDYERDTNSAGCPRAGGRLAGVPGREIVVGAVTQRWMAQVFRALPPAEFAAFDEPGYAKIVWTLRADPIAAEESLFRTETRVNTTDPKARRKFRWYWSLVSPGVALIRRLSLAPLKREAERRAREAKPKPMAALASRMH